MQGAMILGAAGLVIKFLGAAFRIPLVNLIGAQGMAYFQAAYPVYNFFLTLSMAGIPIAISKMVAERIAINRHDEAHRVFRISLVLLFGIGTASAAILFFGAEAITELMKIPNAYASMRAIAPALLFVPIMAAYRGYFQGMQDMRLTAATQTIEQLFRVTCGLFLAYYFMTSSLQMAAAGAAFGATVGGIAGLITACLIYLFRKRDLQIGIELAHKGSREKVRTILLKIMIVAIPITIGASIMPIMNFIDASMVVRVLTGTGMEQTMAEQLFGQLGGMVGSLINFPQVLTQAVSMSLVPAISMAYRQKDFGFMQENIKMGLRTSLIIGFPCAFGLMILAEPILVLIYPMQKASAISAAPCLIIMGAGVIFLSTVQTLTGVLQGIGKQLIPVRNLAIGAGVKILISYQLIGIPGVDVKGAAAGTVTAYLVASCLNLWAVKKHTGVKFDIMITYVKPFSAAAVMAATAWMAHRLFSAFLGNGLGTLFSILLAAIVYVLMLFTVRAITKEEVLKLPKGNKLIKIVNKFVK